MVTIRHVVCDRESYFVKDTATALDAAEYMADRKIGAVCVLDADDKLCGIFSERDLLNRVVVKHLDPSGVPIRDVMSEPLAVIEDVERGSESGLMGLALHPNFAENHLLYLAYAYNQDGVRVRVVRFQETGDGLADRKLIIEGIPAARFHAGTRLRFGPDGKLYVTTGDATTRELAQQLGSLGGKILRLNDDGSVPPDNPFAGQTGARPEIWSYGHRNSQGIDWQPG